jgi:predicted GNAT superfamily acetyltransferase
VEELQKEIWGVTDREVFPALAMRPMMELGGVLIGAFDQDQMVGFVFAFPGLEQDRIILHSDMLAVKLAYRSFGLGYRLKLAQRERALTKHIDTITWTFDPLQAVNAHFNFAKLGVVADRYKVNFYGETSSFLHRAGTDRLWVTWLLNSERVNKRLSQRSPDDVAWSEHMNALVQVGRNLEPVVNTDDRTLESSVTIEIPASINTIVEQSTELATRWSSTTRKAFTEAMNAGYMVADFRFAERSGQKVGVYLLSSSQ